MLSTANGKILSSQRSDEEQDLLERSKKKSKFLPGDPGSSAMDVVEGTVTDSDLGGPTEELADSPTAALVEELSSQDGLATDQPIDLVPETQPTMVGIQTSASIADEIQIAGMHDVPTSDQPAIQRRSYLDSVVGTGANTAPFLIANTSDEFCPTALKPNEEVAPVHEASAAVHEDEVYGPRICITFGPSVQFLNQLFTSRSPPFGSVPSGRSKCNALECSFRKKQMPCSTQKEHFRQ
nr:hypothetical protein Iba_chr12eCG7200 [Ipomoea batatas]